MDGASELMAAATTSTICTLERHVKVEQYKRVHQPCRSLLHGALANGRALNCTVLLVPARLPHAQAGRSIESIFSELACAGLVLQPAQSSLADFLGGERLAQEPEPTGLLSATATAAQPAKAKTGGKKANAAPPPSAAAKAPRGALGKAGQGGAQEELQSFPEPSLAQARQAVAACCVLPLGAHAALGK